LYDVLLDPKSLPETDLESRTAAAAGRNGELYDRQLAIHDEARRVGRAAVNNAAYAGDGRLSGRPATPPPLLLLLLLLLGSTTTEMQQMLSTRRRAEPESRPARPPGRPTPGLKSADRIHLQLGRCSLLHTRSRPPPLRLASAGASRDDGRPYLGPP